MTAHQWTQPEIADRLGLSRSHVYVMRHRGQLPAPSGRVGRVPWWAPDVIEPWMRQWEADHEPYAGSGSEEDW